MAWLTLIIIEKDSFVNRITNNFPRVETSNGNFATTVLLSSRRNIWCCSTREMLIEFVPFPAARETLPTEISLDADDSF